MQNTKTPIVISSILLWNTLWRVQIELPVLNVFGLNYFGTSLVAQLVKNPPAMRKTWVQSLGWEDPLEKGTATHPSILAWRIPWTVIVHGVAKSWTWLSDWTVAMVLWTFWKAWGKQTQDKGDSAWKRGQALWRAGCSAGALMPAGDSQLLACGLNNQLKESSTSDSGL